MPSTPPLVFHLQVGERFELGSSRPTQGAWSTSTPSLVEISADGTVTGLAPGTALITANEIAEDGVSDEQFTLSITILPPDAERIDFRSHHPRLRYTVDEIADRQRLIASGTLPSLGIDIARMYESFLTKARGFRDEAGLDVIFEITGETFTITLDDAYHEPSPLSQPFGFSDYPYWTRLSREIEQRLITLAMAWSLTEDRSFAEKAKSILLAICGWRTWAEYDKPTNNLSLPHFTIGAAVAYDELYSILTNAERGQIRYAILAKGLHPMGYWLDGRLDHNITVLMNAGMIMGALAIADETPQAARFVSPALAGLHFYLEQRESSTTTEGLVYLSYSFNTIFKVAAAIRRATGDDTLLQSSYIRSTLPDMYLYLRGGRGGYANLADSVLRDDFSGLMTYLLNELDDPRAIWILAQESQQDPALFPLLQRDAAIPEIADLGLPLSRHFERIDWVALRSGWSDQDTLLAFTSSPSAVGHNHFDQNHFILNVNSEWMITDPGYQNYTPGPGNVFTNQTIGHNGLLINGEGQSIRGGGKVILSELGATLDHVCGDATDAYEGRLRRWHRHVIFAKPHYILIVDDIIPAHPDDQIEILFHTAPPNTFRLNGGDLQADVSLSSEAIQSGITIQGEETAVTLQFSGDHLNSIRQELFPGAERFGPYLRARLTPASRHLTITAINLDPAIPLKVMSSLPANQEQIEAVAAITITVEREGILHTHELQVAGHEAGSSNRAMGDGDRMKGVS